MTVPRSQYFSALVLLAVVGCSSDEIRLARPPAAFAGYDTFATVGETVTLLATGSWDPDGDVLSYAWRFEARPDGSKAVIQSPADKVAQMIPDREGTYVISLTVADQDQRSRDLVAVNAVASSSTAIDLNLTVVPPTCNVLMDAIPGSACGTAEGRITLEPNIIVTPADTKVSTEWTIFRSPAGVTNEALDLSVTDTESERSLTFSPPRPGAYWIAARATAIEPTGRGPASPLVLASIEVFDAPPAADARPRPEIIAPTTHTMGQVMLLDGRGSFIPTSTVPNQLNHTWTLVADPSGGRDELDDTRTGCTVGACRRLTPSFPGTYIIGLRLEQNGSSGATALHAVEVH